MRTRRCTLQTTGGGEGTVWGRYGTVGTARHVTVLYGARQTVEEEKVKYICGGTVRNSMAQYGTVRTEMHSTRKTTGGGKRK